MAWVSSLMGGVSRQTLAATFPSDHFYCLLDELPLHLVPKQSRKLLSGLPENPQDLILNPECEILSAAAFPKELGDSAELGSAFAGEGSIAWVRDHGGSLLPFWLGPNSVSLVNELRAGKIFSPITNELIPILKAAGVLISRYESTRSRQKEELFAEAGPLFQLKGYAALPGLLHPFHVAALRRYYRSLIRKGKIRLGDAQSPLRYVAHNDPVARFFHRQLAGTISAIAGEPLKPSYVYLASYLSAAELKKHHDREQCEFSITLCLDFSPEPELASPWPIFLETSAGTVAVYQALGDGLAYRGTRLAHYRNALGEGQTSTSIFFHYVSAAFEGPLS
jgi:hypothetical protein